MIEVVAKLTREQNPVYLNGENVECFIEFINRFTPEDSISRCSYETLAWASAQIQCYRNIVGTNKNDNIELKESTTSLNSISQRSGDTIIATKPKILFCDLKLKPNETKIYMYRENLSITGPPTYRGHAIKYFYKLSIATQRVKSKVYLLSVPIRVLPLPIVSCTEYIPALSNETTEELAPNNPFVENKRLESNTEIAWHNLQNITARRFPKFYRISNKRGQVGRFCIFKSAYKLGEDIVGTLDFSSRTIYCVQVSVTLQSEEIMLKKSLADNDTSKLEKTNREVYDSLQKLTNYTKHHEMCLGMMQTQIIIPIPMYVTPTFSTELVDVRWRLHFEFVTSENRDFSENQSAKGEWRAPPELTIETMIWDLPVTIYPSAPLQIFHPSKKCSLVLKNLNSNC